MAYDPLLARRIRHCLAGRGDVTEREMFGGVAYLVRGHMACGIYKERFIVRVDPSRHDELVARPHAGPMDITGRPMRGFLFVDPAGVAATPALNEWVALGTAFAESKPPKPVKPLAKRGAKKGAKTPPTPETKKRAVAKKPARRPAKKTTKKKTAAQLRGARTPRR